LLLSSRRTLISILLLLGLISCREGVQRVGMVTLEKDTVWSGNILVDGDVYVPPGVTLTILPGTLVKFRRIGPESGRNMFSVESPYYPQAEIIVRGRILAQGTPDAPVVFTSAELRPVPADWGAINLLGSRGNVISHARVMCAYNGVHAHGATAVIMDSEFTRNGVAISFKKEFEYKDVPWYGQEAELVIMNNLIYKNKGGIGFRRATAYISYNEIRDNKFFGIWPKEDCSGMVTYNEIFNNRKNIFLYLLRGLTISYNNIHDPGEYNVAVAEAQDSDVDLSNNWWGTVNRERIEEWIFDRKDDPEVGGIIYEPFLKRRIRGAGR